MAGTTQGNSNFYRSWFGQERLLLITGGIGILLGGVCLFMMLFKGAAIPPEGDLFKAVSFNVAIGIFLITTAILLPLVEMPDSKQRLFRWSLFVSSLYSCGAETIQHLRGINPRFTVAGNLIDQVAGGVFGLVSLCIVGLYIMLAFYIFQPVMLKQHPLFTLGLRYGILSTLISFAAGVWMIVLQGRFIGMDGNIIWFHGLGFHGLQVMPLLAWAFVQSYSDKRKQQKLIHLTGWVWNLSLGMIGIQTALGKSLLQLTITSAAFYLLTIAFCTIFLLTAFQFFKNSKGIASIAPEDKDLAK
ncbi:hypothetical protein [Sediminibacillus halophilus]|uniref:Uncharacterized protein n=1 Tax=Sediminibacillus halophilus TaxID=482461 RepID=A0A1G9TQD9_9BACI|nr:hypothetical protein [Sediminibacillus halophilus]SDM50009.1 hypothetical protein SAMN05216244_2686 [Sediminibacillus halophilus]